MTGPNITEEPTELSRWVARFRATSLPVLEQTTVELRRMQRDQENVTAVQVSDVVLHDPLMTLKVLRYLQECRKASQKTDITTIAHALMMLGVAPFFRYFAQLETLQSRLARHPVALDGAMAVCSRARHAALYARDWAVVRHDLEVDEVTVAALLHDLAELLLWCIAPEFALKVRDRQRENARLRSAAAQRDVLGTSLADVQLELAREWQLPALLHDLMDDHHGFKPRVLNVTLATAVARHSAQGWDDPALPDDYATVGRLIGQSPQSARDRIVRVAVKAARDWRWYGVTPAAAWLPLIRTGARLPLRSPELTV